MKIYKFVNGLTIKELKEILADWPETDKNGDPTEVWIETDWCISNIVTQISPLNKRQEFADLILISDNFNAHR